MLSFGLTLLHPAIYQILLNAIANINFIDQTNKPVCKHRRTWNAGLIALNNEPISCLPRPGRSAAAKSNKRALHTDERYSIKYCRNQIKVLMNYFQANIKK